MTITPLEAMPQATPAQTVKPYDSVMSRTLPNTFVPDIELGEAGAPATELLPQIAAQATAEPTFKKTLESMMSDVSDKMNAAEQATNDLTLGKRNDFEKVITTVHEAQLSEQFMLAMRNKLLDAYTDIKSISM
jgi:flagellar hook-basal body complex protein FliE